MTTKCHRTPPYQWSRIIRTFWLYTTRRHRYDYSLKFKPSKPMIHGLPLSLIHVAITYHICITTFTIAKLVHVLYAKIVHNSLEILIVLATTVRHHKELWSGSEPEHSATEKWGILWRHKTDKSSADASGATLEWICVVLGVEKVDHQV